MPRLFKVHLISNHVRFSLSKSSLNGLSINDRLNFIQTFFSGHENSDWSEKKNKLATVFFNELDFIVGSLAAPFEGAYLHSGHDFAKVSWTVSQVKIFFFFSGTSRAIPAATGRAKRGYKREKPQRSFVHAGTTYLRVCENNRVCV